MSRMLSLFIAFLTISILGVSSLALDSRTCSNPNLMYPNCGGAETGNTGMQGCNSGSCRGGTCTRNITTTDKNGKVSTSTESGRVASPLGCKNAAKRTCKRLCEDGHYRLASVDWIGPNGDTEGHFEKKCP
jgi:hypothetical protein